MRNMIASSVSVLLWEWCSLVIISIVGLHILVIIRKKISSLISKDEFWTNHFLSD